MLSKFIWAIFILSPLVRPNGYYIDRACDREQILRMFRNARTLAEVTETTMQQSLSHENIAVMKYMFGDYPEIEDQTRIHLKNALNGPTGLVFKDTIDGILAYDTEIRDKRVLGEDDVVSSTSCISQIFSATSWLTA